MSIVRHPVFDLTPETFAAHSVLHCTTENFRETNCYSDLVVEIVNGLGLNPVACLGYTLAADMEGDQWTFGKPSHHDLEVLYGIRIEELALYRPLVDQIVTQVERGAIPLLEADAFHLPDVAGIDYRAHHVKTTIGITHIDVAQKRMYYFHNATFDKLEGEDFDGVLQPLASLHEDYLPPYCEIAKLDRVRKLDDAELRKRALPLAQHHFAKGPLENPFIAYLAAMESHQQAIIEKGEPAYHAYTFVAPRQLGAAHQLGAHFLRWLGNGDAHFASAATSFDTIASTSKSLVLKLARVSHLNRTVDLTAMLNTMAEQWEQAQDQLRQVLS